jgi:hypothetical protein
MSLVVSIECSGFMCTGQIGRSTARLGGGGYSGSNRSAACQVEAAPPKPRCPFARPCRAKRGCDCRFNAAPSGRFCSAFARLGPGLSRQLAHQMSERTALQRELRTWQGWRQKLAMSQQAPSPAPFEDGLECCREERAAPHPVIETRRPSLCVVPSALTPAVRYCYDAQRASESG